MIRFRKIKYQGSLCCRLRGSEYSFDPHYLIWIMPT